MRKVAIFTLLAGLAVVAVVLGNRMRRAEDADSLLREAQAVLAPPFARVPELSSIGAQRAVQLLEGALDLRADLHTRGLLAYATALDEHQKGRRERATQSLQEARKLPAPGDRLLLLEAAIAHAADDRARAASLIERAERRAPGDSRVRLLAVDVALEAGALARASELLDGLLREHGDLAQLVNRRGLLREQRGEADGALADFTRASALAPLLASPHVNRGRALLARGRLVEAEEAFTQAMQHGPAFDAWLGRGLARMRQGDLAGARVDVERARELGPAQPGPLLALADLDAQDGGLATAVQRYRAALALDAQDAVAWLKLGNALTRSRALPEAKDAYQRALALSPAMAAAHNGLGAALIYLGDATGAEHALARAADLDQGDPNPLLNLALLRERGGDRRGAREARALAAERDPSTRVN
jgi:tetratricopeptide (TPR) repeat protein